jgi:hypothetical protein
MGADELVAHGSIRPRVPGRALGRRNEYARARGIRIGPRALAAIADSPSPTNSARARSRNANLRRTYQTRATRFVIHPPSLPGHESKVRARFARANGHACSSSKPLLISDAVARYVRSRSKSSPQHPERNSSGVLWGPAEVDRSPCRDAGSARRSYVIWGLCHRRSGPVWQLQPGEILTSRSRIGRNGCSAK